MLSWDVKSSGVANALQFHEQSEQRLYVSTAHMYNFTHGMKDRQSIRKSSCLFERAMSMNGSMRLTEPTITHAAFLAVVSAGFRSMICVAATAAQYANTSNHRALFPA